jgi:glycosyltransferase involved in cell wall biosynthesis
LPRRRLLYLHDGKSLYDLFFLNFLKGHFDVVFGTFSRSGASSIARQTGLRTVFLGGPPLELPVHDMVKALLLSPLRTFRLKFPPVPLDADLTLACWATTYGVCTYAAGIRPYGLVTWGSDVLIHPSYPPLRVMASQAIKGSSRIYVDSRAELKAVVGLGAQARKVVSFPRFDLEYVKGHMAAKEACKEKLGLKGREVVIFDRAHDPVHDPLTMIEAIPDIVSGHPDVVVLIAGAGRLTRAMKFRASSLAVAGRTMFLGHLTRGELLDYVGASDVYVSTSRSDGTSSSLLEAMALGAVPVVTSIPGNLEWIEEGVDGFLFPVGSSVELSRKVKTLLESEGLRNGMGETALATVRERVDWASSSQRFLASLSEMMADRL